ncbi:F-box/LRR-repeat protein 13-like protein [Cinnamomum micranthum f. kanehirae]|uniref:F-box/LRR-repeat protein 13-like protein n=1 Tax=Cinnamomum micranthum f. kanehirae TaxID=337451 RepID=A0A3S3QWK7_9MAGN|nr:F-box/LRR-repeat protein 13-like protein [Cinnamomum micranthum f. kanehirae]
MRKKKRTGRSIVQDKNHKNMTHMKNQDEDHISKLPDAILDHILSLIPLKCAVSTSILSKRWKELWKTMWADTTTLDFCGKFATSDQSYHDTCDIINRFVHSHRRSTIDTFRLHLDCVPDIQEWVEFAVEKRVKEIDLDFTKSMYRLRKLPPRLFSCDSLTILKLSDCNLKLPLVFRGFSSLRVVHLTRVEIIQSSLERMLVYCPMLEDLALKSCSDFPMSEISAADLKNIKSCLLIGGCNWSANVGSFLSKLAHVQILTICQMMMHGFKVPGYENAPGNFPITLPDVIELQLEVLNIHSLSDFYDLLTNWNFPCLERLMVKWSPNSCLWSGRVQPSGCVFHCLKMIEMNGFYGDDKQMQMVTFFLEKAVKLDTIVLVTPKEGTEGYVRYDEASFGFLHEQLLLLPKASRNARVVIQEDERR